MTLGVSFHYGDGRESTAESVAIFPVCKRKSVRHPLFFISPPPPFVSALVDLYCRTIFFLFHFHYIALRCDLGRAGREINGERHVVEVSLKLHAKKFFFKIYKISRKSYFF